MTPASYKAGGAGATVVFTVADTSLGSLLVAVTERGLCKIDLSDDARAIEESLHDEFHAADIRRDDDALAPVVDDVVARIDGRVPTATSRSTCGVPRSSAPCGRSCGGSRPARPAPTPRSRRPSARPGRAAPSGSACGANPVPIVVPCHRVVPAAGGVGNYGLGPHRKVELLRREGSLRE